MIAQYPKPSILEALHPDAHGIIEASAGTGKTFTLEHLIIELLLGQPDLGLENILVVTFTERATAELKVRVRRLLANIVGATRGLEFDDVASLPEVDGPCWDIDQADRRRLERSLFSFDVAPIYTIHGFCQRVLTEYAFAHQRAFDQKHVDFPMLFDRAFRDAMRRTLSTRDGTRDWLEAWLEVGSVEELQTLLMRVVTMHAEIWPRLREDPLEEGMREFGARFWEMYRTLYTKSCMRREVAFKKAQEAFVASGSTARFLMLADREVLDLKASLRSIAPANEEQARFLSLVGKLTRFKPAVAQKFLPMIRDAIEREKLTTGTYTYDDMLSMVWASLEGPNGPWLARALRARYRYALIDEFQDTDELQWKIFERLFYQSSGAQRMFVIGDPKQAIYAFRGADVHTYLHACEAMQAPDDRPCHKVHLEQNFRSTEPLIEAYNTILDRNARPSFFSGKKIQYTHPVRCGNPGLEITGPVGEAVSPVVLGIMKRREEGRSSARMDDLYACYGRWIAFEIRKILSEEGKLYVGQGEDRRPVRASDIYILTRSHSDETRLEKFLREAEVPYALYKQEGLFQTPEAWSIFEVLRAIERPHEQGRRLKAWGTRFFGIGLEDLVACRDLTETHPLYKTLLDWAALARQQRFEELFSSLLQSSGLVRREIFFQEDERRLTNYLHLFEVLLEETHRARLDFSNLVVRMKSFIDGRRKPLGLDGNVKRLEQERDAVQLMTMHKSKGLEADVVFLYAFGGFAGEFWPFHYTSKSGELVRALHILKPEPKISPKLRIRVEEESREEDERLLYVALTRARARLYLPFVPYAGSQPICKSLSSRCYNVLNRRLSKLVDAVERGDEALGRLFEIEEIPYFGLRRGDEEIKRARPDLLPTWTPPQVLFEPSQDNARPGGHALRVESYSSLKHRMGGYQTPGVERVDGVYVDDDAGTAQAIVGLDELPGGVRTGQFLHEVLELLDYGTLTQTPDLEDWSGDPHIRALFDRAMLEYGLESELRALSQRVIWRALTTTVPVRDGVIYGLGHCIPNIREMEFWYPIPEASHPTLGQSWEEPPELTRGFIKGYIDYVFEHNGRVYLADWKSDILERYDPAALQAHFDANYLQQALLYTLGLCKVLGITDEPAYESRFGGALYVFLRGLGNEGDHGVLSVNPSWADLRAFEQELVTARRGDIS